MYKKIEVSTTIRELRLDHNLSIRSLASMSGIHKQTLAQIESSIHPPQHHYQAVLDALGINLSMLTK